MAETTQREQQAQERREQIIETALKLFATHGYDGTSTRKIAQAAGITEGLIFHYFPTKAHLLAAVLETRHSFLSDLRDLLDQAEGRPAAAVLPEIALDWLDTLRRERAFTTVLLTTAQIDPQVNAALHTQIGEGVGRMAVYLRSRVEAGELRADLPLEHTALLFYSGVLVFFLMNHQRDDWQTAAESYVRSLVDMWLHGAADTHP